MNISNRSFRQISLYQRVRTYLYRGSIAILFSLASAGTSALGLGTIHVDSSFGQPFSGSVEIFNVSGYDEQTIAVSLASQEVHEQLGIVRTGYLNNLLLELVFEPSGLAHIQIAGKEPLSDPYVEFALEMRWPEGRVVRDYTVLVSMPTASVPPLRAQAPRSAAVETMSRPAIPHSSLYTVETGDTLSEIAERLQGREVSLFNATQTLRAHNAALLETRDSLDLRIGDRLRIPAKAVFSQPAAPKQTLAVKEPQPQAKDIDNLPVTNTERSAEDQPSSSVGSPLAKAETRLRALGYANLQMQAAGERPNPVVASGAAANILEKLITEQSGGNPSYGATQIGRLAEGLNEISDVSRAYQQRLSALEQQTRENAEVLAGLIQQKDASLTDTRVAPKPGPQPEPAPAAIEAVPTGTTAASPIQQQPAKTSLTPTQQAPSAGNELMGWLIWLAVLIPIIGLALLVLQRRQPEPEDAAGFSIPVPAGDAILSDDLPEPAAKPSASPEEPEGSSVIRLDTSPGESPETAEPNEDNIAKLTPFYDEIVADGESPEQVTLEEDLDSELDQELKLISIFEENLASETAIREQIKEEEALISEAMPSGEDDDILDFDVDSLEPEASLEFVLEEAQPEPEIDAEENIAGLDELMDWAPAEKEDVSAQQNRIAEKPDTPTSTNAGSFTGYAESAGFNQINPVEVIDIVNSKLQAAKSADQESTLFYIELDKFEALEKELGVVKIEKLAANVASNIYDRIENPITLRRFRQQGFVLLLSGGQNQQNLQFGQELASAMASTPIEVSGETFFVTLSIGIVPVASGFSDSAEIIEMAQSTVAKVREHNDGNGAELCEIDPDTAYNEASIMRTGRKLLNDSAFVTVYQPVTALKGDPLEFYEARLKIADHIETKNLPDDLIERLGNTDLSTEIDCLNVSQSIAELNDYLNSHISTRVFVAISARTATDNFFKNWFEKTVFSEGIHPERIVFQMPEQCASRHLNKLIEFRDYAHHLGARICVSQLNFQHIPEHALARLHPDFVQLHPDLALEAQHEGQADQDAEKQRSSLTNLTEVLEKARPLCEKIIVPGVSQAKLIPTLWPLSVDYIQGDYIQPESLTMDYEFDQVAE